jgi:shikimate kinase
MRNVILIGFMGTGKTAIGRIVARLLGYQFVDTDQMVEEATGMTINQIFRKHGEVRFRSEEALAVQRLKGSKKTVIATGGGIVLDPQNVGILKENGIFVLFTTQPEVILERVSRRNTRPLLAKGKTLENINKLLNDRRDEYYSCADVVVDTSYSSMEESAEKIVKIIREKEAYEKK